MSATDIIEIVAGLVGRMVGLALLLACGAMAVQECDGVADSAPAAHARGLTPRERAEMVAEMNVPGRGDTVRHKTATYY